MGWRSVIITQHSKLTYTSNMMKVQTDNGINKIPLNDIVNKSNKEYVKV